MNYLFKFYLIMTIITIFAAFSLAVRVFTNMDYDSMLSHVPDENPYLLFFLIFTPLLRLILIYLAVCSDETFDAILREAEGKSFETTYREIHNDNSLSDPFTLKRIESNNICDYCKHKNDECEKNNCKFEGLNIFIPEDVNLLDTSEVKDEGCNR